MAKKSASGWNWGGHFVVLVRFTKDHRCFKAGDTVEFRPGLNLLVGDQGTGKSTVLQEIRDAVKPQSPANKVAEVMSKGQAPLYGCDLEKDLTRGKSYFLDNVDMVFQLNQFFWSHGETVRSVVMGMGEIKDALIVLDEPDMALSPRSAHELARTFRRAVDNGCQVVAAVHNPIVIGSTDLVYSLEHRRVMPPEEFLASQLEPRPEEPKPPKSRVKVIEVDGKGPARNRPRRPARRQD